MVITGIGSRQTPEHILKLFEKVAMRMALDGDILRTGGADGADNAFLKGTVRSGGQFELYLPWPSFNKSKITAISEGSPHPGGAVNGLIFNKPQIEAHSIAAYYHPAWKFLKPGAKLLHARNVHQIFGPNVDDPIFSDLVICWTENGKLKGGTATALRIAEAYDIPIFNVGKTGNLDYLMSEITHY